jgi:hypothetical protein
MPIRIIKMKYIPGLMRGHPNFEGRHNAVRMKTLIILNRDYAKNKYRGLTLREITDLTGENYGTLKCSLGKWARWRFIGFRETYGESSRRYYILQRGRRYLNRWRSIMPMYRYNAELAKAKKGNASL